MVGYIHIFLREQASLFHKNKISKQCMSSQSYYLCNINNMQTDKTTQIELDYAASNLVNGSVTVRPHSNVCNNYEWHTPYTMKTNTTNDHTLEYTFGWNYTVKKENSPSFYAKQMYKSMNPTSNVDNVGFEFKVDALINVDGVNLMDYVDEIAIRLNAMCGIVVYDIFVKKHRLTPELVKQPLNSMKDTRFSSKGRTTGFSPVDIRTS